MEMKREHWDLDVFEGNALLHGAVPEFLKAAGTSSSAFTVLKSGWPGPVGIAASSTWERCLWCTRLLSSIRGALDLWRCPTVRNGYL